MDAYPHADFDTVRPPLTRMCSLGRDRGRDCVFRTREDGKERLSLRVHLATRMLVKRCAHQLVMVRQKLAVRLAQLLEQPSRASTSVKSSVTVPVGTSTILGRREYP